MSALYFEVGRKVCYLIFYSMRFSAPMAIENRVGVWLVEQETDPQSGLVFIFIRFTLHLAFLVSFITAFLPI